MKRRTRILAVLVGLCVVAAGCSSGHGSNLPAGSLSRSSVAVVHSKSTTTNKPATGSTTSSSTTTTTTTTTGGNLGTSGTTGNTGSLNPMYDTGPTGNTGNTGNAGAALPCPDAPTAVLTSSQTSPAPVAGNPALVQLTVTTSGTFTNPSAYPVLMGANLVVSSQTTPNGPTQTTVVPVSATDPTDAGLLAGPITVDWQQNATVNEYAGGQPTVTVAPGWTYSVQGLEQCDQ